MNVKTLKQRVESLEQLSDDDSDVSLDHWGEQIDSGKLANARTTHKRGNNEYVFYLSDFTFWGSANNSVIATEKGISAKYADELQPLFIAWKDVDEVIATSECAVRLLSGGKLYEFIMFQDEVIKDEYIDLFNELANEQTSTYSAKCCALKEMSNTAIRDKLKPKDITSAIADCDRSLNIPLTGLESQYNERGECDITASDYIGVINTRSRLLAALGKTDQAKTDLVGFVEECVKSVTAEENVVFDACLLLSDICMERKEIDDAIVFLNLAACLENPDYQRQAKERLQHVGESKIAYLPNAPRDNRQMILCVDDIPTWPVKEFIFADASMLRNFNWTFEMGHPQTDVMYICHPLRPDHYYEVQSFHDRLFDEKRTELVYLLESIGARHVHVEAMTGTSLETSHDENVTAKGSDEIITGASGEVNRETHDNSRHEKLQVGIEDRDLNPAVRPHIPEDLIWYPHETSWQRIAQSALAKRYKTLSVELRYNEDFSINQKRITKVKGALKLFTKQIEIGWDAATEEHLRARKATVWKYTATFDDEKVTIQESHSTPSALSEAEAEYLDDLKAAVSDGSVPDSGRRILERLRVKLGVSAERAVQLEQSIKELRLTDAEKEYLQDLGDCYADGVFSDSERRMLSRRREKLGITEERASELDHMSKMKQ